jgi:hypothetical protein
MTAFTRSTSGRLMTLSLSLALIGGGASALMQPDMSMYVMNGSLFAAVVAGVASMQLALDEFPSHTVLSLILLPFALFLYVVGLGVMKAYYPAMAYVPLVLGLLSLAFLLRSGTREQHAPPMMSRTHA